MNQKLADHPAVAKIREDLDQKTIEILEEAEEKATTYSLADAIREGSSQTKQAYGTFINAQDEVCALSAAALSVEARGL